MKLGLLGFAAIPLLAATWSPKPPPITLVIGGEFRGYLSPCGCSEPMQGGVGRFGGLVAASRQSGKTIALLNGSITNSLGRQSEMKAETVAELVRTIGCSGYNLTSNDARLGVGTVSAMQSLSGGKLVSTAMPDQVGRVAGPFWITGYSTRQPEIVAALETEPATLESSLRRSGGRPVILLLEGDLLSARRIAAQHSQVRLIVYTSPGKSPTTPQKEGKTWLVHPGERGTSALRLTWSGGEWTSYQVAPLGPEVSGDAAASRVFHNYLKRVTDEDLVSQMPRSGGPDYAGSALCISCHSKAGDIWRNSKHAAALATLEREGHGRDPDCISCHVVDIHKSTGFRTRTETPTLTDVGCESCHGPGKAHAMRPLVDKMHKIDGESCMKCHTANNSPRFNFDAYWKKIAH
ncbi:MAG: cytochrome c family protein [Chthonomonas sp.]|nr:cytochrome c family protein [Chthonomonas sp.]